MEKSSDQLLQKALDNTAKEYADNAKGQGKNLAAATQALTKTGAATCVVASELIERSLDIPRLAIYGYDKVRDLFIPKVAERIESIPEDKLIQPNEEIAGPILEAVRFKTSNEEISNLFASLLAAAMNMDTKELVHPAFIQIINELTSDEAKILNYFALSNRDAYPMINLNAKMNPNGYSHPAPLGEKLISSILKHFTDLGYVADCTNPIDMPMYVDNLCRLKLFDVPFGIRLADKNKDLYAPLKAHEILKAWITRIEGLGGEIDLEETTLSLTPFGNAFVGICNSNKGNK